MACPTRLRGSRFFRKEPRTASFSDSPRPPAAPPPSRLTRTLTGHTKEVIGVAFSRTGPFWPPSAGTRPRGFWDVATGKTVRTLTGHTSYIHGVAFSSDGTLLATAAGDDHRPSCRSSAVTTVTAPL